MTFKVLITGATGFVGGQVLHDLLQQNSEIYVLVRSENHTFPAGVKVIQTESIERYVGEQLPDSLDGIVHLVAKAHVTENEADREEYTRVNVEGTRALLRVAKAKQVKHFVYMSSIKASGEFPESGTLTEREPGSPQGVYGETKWQAEQLLSELSQAGIRVSVVRPPLVYGVGVKANMAALVKLVKWLPALPFGRVRNKRSMISVRNLSNFVMTLLLTPPREAYQHEMFIVSDKQSLSTAQLCRWIAQGLSKKVWMLPVPASFLSLCVRLLGMHKPWQKLTGNAQVQGEHPGRYFNWQAPYESSDEIIAMVRGRR